jgi:hypothetical protein
MAESQTPQRHDGNMKASMRGRRKWRKPKDKPKPPMSAYNLFYQEQISLLSKEKSCETSKSMWSFQSEMDGVEVGSSKHIFAKWNSLDPESKSKYELEAKQGQQQYAKEIQTWQNRKFQLGEQIDDKRDKELLTLSSDVASAVSSAVESKASEHASNKQGSLKAETHQLNQLKAHPTDQQQQSQHPGAMEGGQKRRFLSIKVDDPSSSEFKSTADQQQQFQYPGAIEGWQKRRFQNVSIKVDDTLPESLFSVFNSDQFQYPMSIEGWQQRRFQNISIKVDDPSESLSSVGTTRDVVEVNSMQQAAQSHAGTERSKAEYTTKSENCLSDGRKSNFVAHPSKPAWLDRNGLEPTPLPSKRKSPKMRASVSLTASAKSDNSSLESLFDNYIHPNSMSQLASQLEEEEVEFLASLRHSR